MNAIDKERNRLREIAENRDLVGPNAMKARHLAVFALAVMAWVKSPRGNVSPSDVINLLTK